MALRLRWQASAAVLALVALAAAVLYAPAADTAPGDVADLGIVKSDSPDPVFVGAVLTYAIQVTNLGPQEATGVTVTDELPSHATFLSASASSGSCEQKGKRVTCGLGNLAIDPTKANAVTVTIQVRPTKAGTITNTASVDSVENDPVAVNDKATVSTQVPSCRGTRDGAGNARPRPLGWHARPRRDRGPARCRRDLRPRGP